MSFQLSLPRSTRSVATVCCVLTLFFLMVNSITAASVYETRCAVAFNQYDALVFDSQTCDSLAADFSPVCFCSCSEQCGVTSLKVYAQCYNTETDEIVSSSDDDYSANCQSQVDAVSSTVKCAIDTSSCPTSTNPLYGNVSNVVLEDIGAAANLTELDTDLHLYLGDASELQLDLTYTGSLLSNLTFTLVHPTHNISLLLLQTSAQIFALESGDAASSSSSYDVTIPLTLPSIDLSALQTLDETNPVVPGFIIAIAVSSSVSTSALVNVVNSTEFSIATYCAYQYALAASDPSGSSSICNGHPDATCPYTANACVCPSFPDWYTSTSLDCSCADIRPTDPTECVDIIVQDCAALNDTLGNDVFCENGGAQFINLDGQCTVASNSTSQPCLCTGLWSSNDCTVCDSNVCGANGTPSDDCSYCSCNDWYSGTTCQYDAISVGVEFATAPSFFVTTDTSAQLVWEKALIAALSDISGIPSSLFSLPTHNDSTVSTTSVVPAFAPLSTTVTSSGALRVSLPIGYSTTATSGLPSRTQVMNSWTTRVTASSLNAYPVAQEAGSTSAVTPICSTVPCSVYSYGEDGKEKTSGLGFQIAVIVVGAVVAILSIILIVSIVCASRIENSHEEALLRQRQQREKQPLLNQEQSPVNGGGNAIEMTGA